MDKNNNLNSLSLFQKQNFEKVNRPFFKENGLIFL